MSDEELAAECKSMRKEEQALGNPKKLDNEKAMRYYQVIANLAVCNASEISP